MMMTLILTALFAEVTALALAMAVAEVRRSRAERDLIAALDGFDVAPSSGAFFLLRARLESAERAGVYLPTYSDRIRSAASEAPLHSLLCGWGKAVARLSVEMGGALAAAERLQSAFADMGRVLLRSPYRTAAHNAPTAAHSAHR